MATLIAANYQSQSSTAYGFMYKGDIKLKNNTLYTFKCRYKWNKNSSGSTCPLAGYLFESTWSNHCGASGYFTETHTTYKTMIRTFTTNGNASSYTFAINNYANGQHNNGVADGAILDVDWYELWEGDATTFSLTDAIALSGYPGVNDFLTIQGTTDKPLKNPNYFSTVEEKNALRSWMGYYYKNDSSTVYGDWSYSGATRTRTVTTYDHYSNGKKVQTGSSTQTETATTSYGNWSYNWTTSGSSTRTRSVTYTWSDGVTKSGTNQTETGGTRYIVLDSFSDNKSEGSTHEFGAGGGTITARIVSHDYWPNIETGTHIRTVVITGVTVKCDGFNPSVSGSTVTFTANSKGTNVSAANSSTIESSKSGFTTRKYGACYQAANSVTNIEAVVSSTNVSSVHFTYSGGTSISKTGGSIDVTPNGACKFTFTSGATSVHGTGGTYYGGTLSFTRSYKKDTANTDWLTLNTSSGKITAANNNTNTTREAQITGNLTVTWGSLNHTLAQSRTVKQNAGSIVNGNWQGGAISFSKTSLGAAADSCTVTIQPWYYIWTWNGVANSGGTTYYTGSVSVSENGTYTSLESTSYTASSSAKTIKLSKSTCGANVTTATNITVTANPVTDGPGTTTGTISQSANTKTFHSVFLHPYKPDSSWIIDVNNNGTTDITDDYWATCPASGGYVKLNGYKHYTYTSGSSSDELITTDAAVTWSTGKDSWITNHTNGGYYIHSRGTTIGNARSSTATWTYDGKTSAGKTLSQSGNYVTKIEANSNSFSYANIGAGATSATPTSSHAPKYTFTSGSTSTTTPSSTYGTLSTSVTYTIANTTTNGFTAINSSTGVLTATGRGTTIGNARKSATVTKTLKYTWTHTNTYGGSSVNTGNLSKTATCTQNANYITSVTLSVSAGAITHSAGTVGAGGGTVSVTSSTNGSYSGTLKYSSNSEKAASTTEGTWSAAYSWTESDANNMLSFTSANSSGMTVTVATRGTTVGDARSSTITRKYSVTYTLKSGYNNIVTSKSDNKSTSALTISQAANAAKASSKITSYGKPGAVTIGSGITAGGGSATLSAKAPTNVKTYYYTSGSPGSTENVTGSVTYTVSSQYFSASASATSGTNISRYSVSSTKLNHSSMAKNVGYDFVTVKAANAGDSSKYTTASTKVQNSVGPYYVTAYGKPGTVTIGSGITAGGGSATLSASAPTNNTRRDYTSGSYDTSTATGSVTYTVSSQYFSTSSSATSGTAITRYSISSTKLNHSTMAKNVGYDFVTVKAENTGDSSKYTTASTKVQNSSTDTYDTPKILSYTYATFAASGATKTPTVTYEQTGTRSYTSGSSSALTKKTSGGTLKFNMTASNGFTLGSTSTGSMTAANNTTTTSTRTPSTMPTVTVTLSNKTSAAYSCTACSQSGGSRYFRVKSVSATTTTLPDVYNGYQSIYVTMQTTISGSKPSTSNAWSDIKGSEVASYSSGNTKLGMYIYVNATGDYNDTSYINVGTPSLLNASSGKYYPTSTSSGVTRPKMNEEAKWMVNFTWHDAQTEYSTTNTICVQWQEMANYGYSGAGKNYVQVTRNAKQNSGIPIYLYGYNGAGTDLYYQFAGRCIVKYSDPYSSGPVYSIDFNEPGNISADYGSSYGLTRQMSDYPFEVLMVAGEPIGLVTVEIYGDISNTLNSSLYNGCDMHIEIVDTSSSNYGGNTLFTSSAQTISTNYNPLRYGQRTCSFQVSGWIPAYANLEIRLCFVFSNK